MIFFFFCRMRKNLWDIAGNSPVIPTPLKSPTPDRGPQRSRGSLRLKTWTSDLAPSTSENLKYNFCFALFFFSDEIMVHKLLNLLYIKWLPASSCCGFICSHSNPNIKKTHCLIPCLPTPQPAETGTSPELQNMDTFNFHFIHPFLSFRWTPPAWLTWVSESVLVGLHFGAFGHECVYAACVRMTTRVRMCKVVICLY